MQFAADEIKPNLEFLDVRMLPLDDVALYSWRESLIKIMPEMKRVLMDSAVCRQCGENCGMLCPAGENVVWGLSQIRFQQASLSN